MANRTYTEDEVNRIVQTQLATLLAGMGNGTFGGGQGLGAGVGFNTNQNRGPWAHPIGGPGGVPATQGYAPSGLIFPGGSPFPVDQRAVQLQNAMIVMRDLLPVIDQFRKSQAGQQVGAKVGAGVDQVGGWLKGLLSGGGTP